MAKISEPIGALWKLFSGRPEPLDQEIRRLLKRLLTTPRGELFFWPDFGVERPKDNFTKNSIELMKKQIERLYGEFFRAHSFVISLDKMAEEFKKQAFGSDTKEIKGDIYYIKIQRHEEEIFGIYWNFRREKWEFSSEIEIG